jgi:hypothetical protein
VLGDIAWPVSSLQGARKGLAKWRGSQNCLINILIIVCKSFNSKRYSVIFELYYSSTSTWVINRAFTLSIKVVDLRFYKSIGFNLFTWQ